MSEVHYPPTVRSSLSLIRCKTSTATPLEFVIRDLAQAVARLHQEGGGRKGGHYGRGVLSYRTGQVDLAEVNLIL